MATSALALAGYAPDASSRSGAVSPPPFFPTVRDRLTQVDYSLAHPAPSEITPAAVVKHAIAKGRLDQAVREVEKQLREASGPPLTAAQQEYVHEGCTPMEARLLDQLLDRILRHPDAKAALEDVENKTAAGTSINHAAAMARLVGVSHRVLSSEEEGSVKMQMKHAAEQAMRGVRTSERSMLFSDAQHPTVWFDRVGSAPTSRIDRMVSSTTESLILSMQNERIDASNRSHERIAQRNAAKVSPARSVEDPPSSRGSRTPDAFGRQLSDRTDLSSTAASEQHEIVDVDMEDDMAIGEDELQLIDPPTTPAAPMAGNKRPRDSDSSASDVAADDVKRKKTEDAAKGAV
jgi:hypothetical protein